MRIEYFFAQFLKKVNKKGQKNFAEPKFRRNFAAQKRKDDSVAQLVEQLTLNQWVEGSSPSGVTKQNGKSPQSTEIT